MGMWDWLSNTRASDAIGVEQIYPLPINQDDFIKIDVRDTYAKILTDTLERVSGIPERAEPLLWDNCVQSESQDGLVSLLSKAMVGKADLFIVYKPALGVLREATYDEAELIRRDYKAGAHSNHGVFVSFKNY